MNETGLELLRAVVASSQSPPNVAGVEKGFHVNTRYPAIYESAISIIKALQKNQPLSSPRLAFTILRIHSPELVRRFGACR